MADILALDQARARLQPRETGPLELTGRSAAVLRVQELVRRAAALSSPVLLVADRGIATESVARELHDRSRGAAAPFVPLNCAAVDGTTLERLLFGRAPGSGSAERDAVAPESGLAAASGGTLFLDDVHELPGGLQTRLARIMRDGEMQVDDRVTAFDVRVIAGGLPAIDVDVREQRFRMDLYRRLSATRIDLPSLRDRAEDVPVLAKRLLDDACLAEHLPPRTFTQAALALLGALTWPGNVAELQTAIAAVVRGSSDATIPVEQLLPALRLDRAAPGFTPAGSLRDARQRFERDYIAAVLQHHQWRVADAAQTLGIQRPNLYRKARQLGIPVARVSDPSGAE